MINLASRQQHRFKSIRNSQDRSKRGETTALIVASCGVAMFALSYASVPLYKIYCQSTGSGQAVKDNEDRILGMKKDDSRLLTVRFNASNHKSMDCTFKPVQNIIKVSPGETALAFYRVINPSDEAVIGVATYNILPYEAGQYFNKIQCFCFEEQLIKPKDDVFMPVLFYIHPDFSKDPYLASTSELTLSYTFFRTEDGNLPDDVDEPIELRSH